MLRPVLDPSCSQNAPLKSCIEKMYAAGKVVAADCHGPIALPQCNKANGEPLVKGLEVTGFSDTEEAAVGLTEKVPFLVEAKMVRAAAAGRRRRRYYLCARRAPLSTLPLR
jgi:putative intracellular protease/amidase